MKRKRTDPEVLAKWDADRRAFEVMFEGIKARFAELDAREAARKARLRRWSFGLLGRT